MGAPTVLADVPAILIDVLELAQRLDNEYVLFGPGNDQLCPFVQAVIRDLKRLQNVPPVFALVIEPLVDHIHDFVELG
jgi:hypothetical protein